MTATARAHDASARPVLSEAISSTGVIAIGRGVGPGRAVEIADALLRGGVRAFEVTIDPDAASDALAAIATLTSVVPVLVSCWSASGPCSTSPPPISRCAPAHVFS